MPLTKDKATYPVDHKIGMRIPKGGASCANCSYLAANQKDCANKYFIAWNSGDPRIPFPANEYTSDWYEAKDGLEAEGTSEGAEKGWDTRGRGRHVPDSLKETMVGRLLHPEDYHDHAVRMIQELDKMHSDDPSWKTNVAEMQKVMKDFPFIHTEKAAIVPDIEKEGIQPAVKYNTGLEFDKIAGLNRSVFMRMGQAGGGGQGAVGVMIDPSKLDPDKLVITRLGLMTLKQQEDAYLRTPGDHLSLVSRQLYPYMNTAIPYSDLSQVQSRLLVNGYEIDNPDSAGKELNPSDILNNDHGEMEVKYADSVPKEAVIGYFAGNQPLADLGGKSAYDYLKGKVPDDKLIGYDGEGLHPLSMAYRSYYANKNMQAAGTSEGVRKEWDTRGRGRKQPPPLIGHKVGFKGWDAKTGFLHDGVDVAIFDRYNKTNPAAVSVRTFLHNPSLEADKRQALANAFKQAVPTGTEDVDIQTLVPTQNTVFKAGLEKMMLQGLYPNPVTVFRYHGSDYLMDGHHRTVANVIDGRGSVEANIFQLKTQKELDAARKLEGRTEFRGLDISIETDKGSVRKGIGKDGKPWAVKMTVPYGYFRMTQGVDGDHVDCFVGPNEDAENVYVVHTNDPTTGDYDEDKALVGFDSADAAKKAFLENYSSPKFFGSMDTLPFEKFKEKVLQTKDDPQRITAHGTSEEGLNIDAAITDLLGSGTSEGVKKAWDTRGRGRKEKEAEEELMQLLQGYPSEEPPKGGEFYHGTISEAVKKILQEGLKQNLDLQFNTFDLNQQQRLKTSDGYVYLTKEKYIAQWYAMLKAKYEAAKPGMVKFPDPTGHCCFRLVKPAISSVFSSDKSAPAVVTLDVPDRAAKGLEDDPASVPSWKSFRTTGVLPKSYVSKVEVLDHMDESNVHYSNAALGDKIGLPKGTWRDVWDKQKQAIAAENTQQIHIVWFGDLDELKKLLTGESTTDVKAEALFRGVKVLGFTGAEEEFVNATVSRVPPELLTNVKCIIAAPWLGAKHGRYVRETKTIYLNPKNVRTRVRLGEGQGFISHGELTTVHEIMHSVYDNLPEEEKDKWMELSGWMIGTKDGQAPAYVEKRSGWEPGASKWTHKTRVEFPRIYSEKNPDEDFADCAAFYFLNKAHQIGTKKIAFLDSLFSKMVKNYPNFNVHSPEKPYGEKHVAWALNAYGTSEGVEKEWDERGRGRKIEGALLDWSRMSSAIQDRAEMIIKGGAIPSDSAGQEADELLESIRNGETFNQELYRGLHLWEDKNGVDDPRGVLKLKAGDKLQLGLQSFTKSRGTAMDFAFDGAVPVIFKVTGGAKGLDVEKNMLHNQSVSSNILYESEVIMDGKFEVIKAEDVKHSYDSQSHREITLKQIGVL